MHPQILTTAHHFRRFFSRRQGVARSLAWYLSETARAFLFGIGPTDPRAYAAAAISLLATAFVAAIVPAWRAASIDPVSALRAE